MKIYSLYDRKSSSYGTVFTSDNDQTALRYFQFLCSMPVNELIRDDIELYYLGDFNVKDGNISNVSKDFVSNFVYEPSISERLRQEGRTEILQEMQKRSKEVRDEE